ncbi:MAG: dCTP deaminase [Mycobacterium sp.]|nr:dCTP deaminase [Mycobacterium sp.]
MTPTQAARQSIDGVVRTASAIDSVLELIRRELAKGFLPQRKALIAALRFDTSMADRVTAYAERLVRLNQLDDLPQTLFAVGLQLGQLEDALVDLRRAVSWSSRFSAFNWWLENRQKELGLLSNFLVIPGPGSCRDFHIEPTPSVAQYFDKANKSLRIPESSLQQIRRIRILTVPQFDGASARWHPISLGHELAHLRFNEDWVLKWLSGRSRDRGSAQQAVAKAKQQLGSDVLSSLPERWFTELTSWLVECACDTVLHYFYGDESLVAMSTFLSSHSDSSDSAEHPSPKLRLAVLKSNSSTALRRFHAPPNELAGALSRKNAFCQLAIPCRDEVRRQLQEVGVNQNLRAEVLDSALRDDQLNSPPHSANWGWSSILDDLSSIEAGLVSSLWSGRHADMSNPTERSNAIRLQERRVEQAVDFLQFAHRFEKERLHRHPESIHDAKRDEDETPSNVLYVSRDGVSASGEMPGGSSHDVRLGRHFIVFKRNQISVLNALDRDAESRQIQEEVEVGWGEKFILHPHEMVLAVTLESLIISADCTAQVLSRSSLGRMGLLSATAVQVQPGFRGCLTLELVNLASVPLGLSPGQRIAQIVPILRCGTGGYEGKYQDQDWKPRFSEVLSDRELPILVGLSRLAEEENA